MLWTLKHSPTPDTKDPLQVDARYTVLYIQYLYGARLEQRQDELELLVSGACSDGSQLWRFYCNYKRIEEKLAGAEAGKELYELQVLYVYVNFKNEKF